MQDRLKDCGIYHRIAPLSAKLKELEMGQMDLKAGYTMCLYYLGKHPEGLTATQLTELCKEDKAAISRTLSQLSSKGLVSCELPEHKRSYRTLYYLTEEGNTVVKRSVPGSIPHWLTAVMA